MIKSFGKKGSLFHMKITASITKSFHQDRVPCPLHLPIFFLLLIKCIGFCLLLVWCRGVVGITTAQLHSTKPELRFCAGSNPACDVSEIRDGEDPWQWSRLEIRLNAFRRSTISQKQFINSSSTFLLGSLTVTLTVLIFCIYFYLLMLVFVLQWLSLHWEILIIFLFQFLLNFCQTPDGMPRFIM